MVKGPFLGRSSGVDDGRAPLILRGPACRSLYSRLRGRQVMPASTSLPDVVVDT